MDSRHHQLRVLRKGWPLVLAFVVLGSVLGVGATLATKKVYQATVQVFVATSAASDPTQLSAGNTFTAGRVQSYTSIAAGPSVTDAVRKRLKLPLTQQELADKISADAPMNKVLVNLHVTDHDPRQAARLANAVATEFNAVVQQTEQTSTTGEPAVKLTVIRPATVPQDPIKPSKVLYIGLGFLLGLLVGIGVVILRDALDNTVKGPEDFEPLGIPLLGFVPFDKQTPKVPVAFRDDPHSQRSEAYRQLRANLQFVNVDNAPRIIAVTSAIPGEGKTTTAVNLAAALAEAGYRVCLIEADLRRPSLATMLGLVGDVGFTTAIIGKAPVESVLQNVGRNLAVLTSGRVPPNPNELLLTAQARTVIEEIGKRVDYTIIDTAPLLPVADTTEIAVVADATIVVHRAGKSTREQATRCVASLAKVGEKPVGVVLNMVTRGLGRAGDAYGYYYAYRPDKSRRVADSARRPKHEAQRAETPATVNGAGPEFGVGLDLIPQRRPLPDRPFASMSPDATEYASAEPGSATANGAANSNLTPDESDEASQLDEDHAATEESDQPQEPEGSADSAEQPGARNRFLVGRRRRQ